MGTIGGAGSLQNSATDPLLGYDVIVNAGATYPSATNTVARQRLADFFARGGGYIGTTASGNSATARAANFAFLSSAGLVSGIVQGDQSAYGGIALWNNAGAGSPISGAYPSSDFMFLPSTVTYFLAVPATAAVDGRYLDHISQSGAANGFISGMWLNRDAAADSAPVLIHGSTTAKSRYVAYATIPFSRYDAEREWPLIVQAALWTNLTDE